jgi:hypothetical protein
VGLLPQRLLDGTGWGRMKRGPTLQLSETSKRAKIDRSRPSRDIAFRSEGHDHPARRHWLVSTLICPSDRPYEGVQSGTKRSSPERIGHAKQRSFRDAMPTGSIRPDVFNCGPTSPED